MADEHSPEMRSFVIANIRKTRLRDRTPDQQLAVEFADARDRDVAELVAALEQIIADFDGRVFVLNAAIAADGPPIKSIADARQILAKHDKHKGGA